MDILSRVTPLIVDVRQTRSDPVGPEGRQWVSRLFALPLHRERVFRGDPSDNDRQQGSRQVSADLSGLSRACREDDLDASDIALAKIERSVGDVLTSKEHLVDNPAA